MIWTGPSGRQHATRPTGVSEDEIVDLFIHLEAYAGAARAFDMHQIVIEVFTETDAREQRGAAGRA